MLANAPTDNLYKFATFLGIALFVFCTWQSTERYQKIESQLLDARLQEEILNLRLKDNQDTIAELKAETNEAMKPEEFERRRQEWIARLDQVSKSNDGLMPEWEKVHTSISRATLDQIQYLEDEKWSLKVGQIGGLVAAALGILLWYLLHQRHQDALLRAQLMSAKSSGASR
ncbi:hypothetical protein AM571_CH01453 [Rhizobium etli 8C-3]|uniref:Uncharacterized protein n=1 Tax=Rhizobium etli 8C-3 TaxID=538025 RepID=A0A1L5P2C5_RHIET|nr:hypothetical protein [Rhizobium etli]APO74288.1 hypothetical protein AM571_CH01453 [Rhizobium etli 8C-3]